MKHVTNWPVILQDGGWRERRKSGQYWPQYYRRKNRTHQLVSHVESFGDKGQAAWVLEVGSLLKASGSLEQVLLTAEVAT